MAIITSGSSTLRRTPLSLRDHARSSHIRWLLRGLVEPAFLRLYLEKGQVPPTFRAFEDAFFSLTPGSERPLDHRQKAWDQLEAWVRPAETGGPAAWFCAVLRGLRGRDHLEDAKDLGRFWALGELFDDDDTAANQAEEAGARYHEIHCHLRGGVPYLALWRGFVESDRKRAVLRHHACEAGTWQKTWAELVDHAAHDRAGCLHLVPGGVQDGAAHGRNISRAFVVGGAVPEAGQNEAAHIRALVRHVVDSSHVELADHTEHAVRYLATCAGLSAFLLHQRGTAGLSPFVDSYDRFVKLQKPRGSPERQQTRDLVASTLHRFESEGAAAVELRPTLDRCRRDLQRKLQDIVLGYFDYLATVSDGRHPVALGLVPSLFKQEALRKGEPTDPDFWREQQEIWADQVRGLLAILCDSPTLRWFVVGLDAAGKERGCPPGALRPAFDLVRVHNRGRERARPGRRMSVRALRALRRGRGSSDDALAEIDGRPIEHIRLGITVHAGEDFEDPLTGLRHIWETAVDLDLNEGDRIGHALAAGLDEAAVRTLLERRAGDPGGEVRQLDRCCFQVRKPRGTHLLDLAWICRVGQQSEVRDAELRLGEVAARAFGAPAGAALLARELCRPGAGALTHTALPGIRFEDPRNLGAHDLETMVIDTPWLALFESLRTCVLRELVRRRIVVESCPTSNLVVANLDQPPLLTLLETTHLR